jgi:hypothetical protein
MRTGRSATSCASPACSTNPRANARPPSRSTRTTSAGARAPSCPWAANDYDGAFGYIQLDAGSELAKALTIHTLVRAGREAEALRVERPYMPQWKSYALLLACVERRPVAETDALAGAVLPDDDPETNYFSAAHLSYCGRTQEAIELLERSIAGPYCSSPVVEPDPFFAGLRARPEFARIRASAIACRDDFLARRDALN